MSELVQIHHPRPSPRSAVLPIEAVDAHRDIWCRHYDGCLDVAVRKDWISWSCASCPLMGKEQSKPELKVGGGSSAAQMMEEAGEAPNRVSISAKDIWPRLSDVPTSFGRIAVGYQGCLVRMTLKRLSERGLVEETPKGWRKTGRRICSRCKANLPAEAFVRRKNSADGRGPECRPCYQARKREEVRRRKEREAKRGAKA